MPIFAYTELEDDVRGNGSGSVVCKVMFSNYTLQGLLHWIFREKTHQMKDLKVCVVFLIFFPCWEILLFLCVKEKQQ